MTTRARRIRDEIFPTEVDVLLFSSLSPFDNHKCLNRHSTVPAEAIKKLQLIQLLKQDDPNLHVCFLQSANKLLPAKDTTERGTQFPDVQYQLEGLKQPELKGATYIDDNDPYMRVLTRFELGICEKSHLNTWRETSRVQSLTATASAINIFNKDVGFSLTKPMLRVNAPPFIPRSIYNRSQLDGDQVSSTDAENTLGSAKTNAIRSELEQTLDLTPTENDDSDATISAESEETFLQRKLGQFYCRRCLHGWYNRYVWCVRDTKQVYVKQTCNICCKVVNPFVIMEI